jgi:hypothetical protein
MSGSGIFVSLIAITATFVMSQALGIDSQSRTESAKPFIGMWRLVSIVDMKGHIVRGQHPTGFIVYDASGNMCAQIMPDTPRPKFAGEQPTPDEASAALNGYTAYFGTYTVDERAHTVTHHVKGSINPGTVGADNVRGYEFGPGDRVTLTTMPVTETSARLTWERVK